jgi:hypothetical protein
MMHCHAEPFDYPLKTDSVTTTLAQEARAFDTILRTKRPIAASRSATAVSNQSGKDAAPAPVVDKLAGWLAASTITLPNIAYSACTVQTYR